MKEEEKKINATIQLLNEFKENGGLATYLSNNLISQISDWLEELKDYKFKKDANVEINMDAIKVYEDDLK